MVTGFQLMDNNIYKKQNEKEMQSLIVAQHFVYKRAKAWVLLLFGISVVIPIALNVGLIWIRNDVAIGCISFGSILLLIFSECIRNKISLLKEHASMIQQKFDVEVFGLSNNFDINEDIVQSYLEKYKNKDWDRKKNWYVKHKTTDKNQAIFYCQKENIDWTNNISKKYTKFLVCILIIMIILFILNIILYNTSVLHLISVIINALPLLSYCYSSFIKIKNDNKLIDKISIYSNKIMDKLKNEGSLNNAEIENLQWMIYFLRRSKYLIPEWFDKLFYKEIESLEKRKAKSNY